MNVFAAISRRAVIAGRVMRQCPACNGPKLGREPFFLLAVTRRADIRGLPRLSCLKVLSPAVTSPTSEVVTP
jgi:hypothetical protein